MSQTTTQTPRPRARDLGVVVGILAPGKNNAITDVAGVRVGHATLIKGANVRTGVTAILPVSADSEVVITTPVGEVVEPESA